MLGRALDELERGNGCTLIVEGEPGTGKTVILDELMRHAASVQHVVLASTATLLDTSAPFGLARRLLGAGEHGGDLAEALSRLDNAHLSLAAAVEEGASIVDDLARSITALVGERGLVVVVDDAQWADAGTLGLLRALAEDAASLPAIVAVAVRSESAGHGAIAGLRRTPGALPLVLADLSPAGTGELVRRRLPAATPAFATACHGATGGNPLLVDQLTLDFAQRQLAPDAAAAARLQGLVPRTVLDSVLVRLGELGADAVDVALAVAVLGDAAPLHRVAALVGAPLMSVAAAAEQLVSAAILTGHDALTYRHPLLAAGVLDDAGEFRVAALHRRAADLLQSEGEVELSAAHLLHATPAGDEQVVTRLRRAAGAALRRGDAHSAARFLGRAVNEPPQRGELPDVLIDAAKADTASGGTSGADWLERALALLDDPQARASALIELARIHHLRTDFLAAERLASRAIESAGAQTAVADQARAIWLFAVHHSQMQDAVAEELGRLFGEFHAGRVPTEPEQLSLLGLMIIETFPPPEAVVELARAALERHVNRTVEGPTYVVDYAAGALIYMGELAECERLTTAAHAAALRSGSIIAAAAATAWRGVARLRRGDLEAAAADAAIALAPDQHGWRYHTGQGAAVLAMARLEQGDVVGAQAAVARAADMSNPQPLHLVADGWVRLATSDLGGAEKAFREAGRQLTEIWNVQSPAIAWRAGVAHALVAQGDRRAGREIAAEELALTRRSQVPHAIAVSLQACAAAAPADEAVDLLREALASLDGTDEALERVRIRVELGAALRRIGERQSARDELALARDDARRLGLHALLARAGEELRASGARRRERWAHGPESLTPTERMIAGRAAAGETNTQIAGALYLTRKTVEWHLGNVFRKLGIAKRGELAAALKSSTGD